MHKERSYQKRVSERSRFYCSESEQQKKESKKSTKTHNANKKKPQNKAKQSLPYATTAFSDTHTCEPWDSFLKPLRQTTVSSAPVFDLFTSLASVLLLLAFSHALAFCLFPETVLLFCFGLGYTCGWILVVNVNGATKSMRIWSGSHALRKFYENWMDESAHWARVPFLPPTLVHLFTLLAPLVLFRKLCSKLTIFLFLIGFKMLKQFRYFTNLANLVDLVLVFYYVS